MKQVFLACVFLLTSLYADLPTTTKILTPNAHTKIEELSIGSEVLTYDPATNSFPTAIVQNISKHTSSSIIEICTNKGSLYASPQQEFFDASQNKFIPAKEFSATSILVGRNHEQIPCTAVKELLIQSECHKLSLSSPHIFFSSDLEVLTHNYIQAFPTIVSALTDLAKIGTAIACFHFFKTEKRLPDKSKRPQFEITFKEHHEFLPQDSAWQAVTNEASLFKQDGGRAFNFDSLEKRMENSDTVIFIPSKIAGINMDSDTLEKATSNFQRHNPTCLSGKYQARVMLNAPSTL